MWPQDAWQPPLWRLSGVFPVEGSNSVGTTGAVLAVVAVSRLLWRKDRTSRSWYTVLFTFGFITMLASQTRNAIAGFLFGVGVLLLASKRTRVGLLLALILVPLLLFTGVGDLTWQYLERGQDEGRLASLTGRVGWWSFAWQQVMRHPWTGLGAYAGGRFSVMGELGLGGVSNLHSDYVEILVGTSFWGLLPFLAALLGTWWFLARNLRNSSAGPLERRLTLESLGVIAVLTVHSFFNTDLIWHAPLFFLLVVGYAEFVRHKARPPLAVVLAAAPVSVVETPIPEPVIPALVAPRT
jgi:O-antigen ligase